MRRFGYVEEADVAPTERSIAMGGRPAGLTSPKSTDATAVPASSPPMNELATVGTESAIQSTTNGRP